MEKVKAHVFIQGEVQGVFFRSWMKKTAEKLNVSGWVKNLDDGRVEALLQGERQKVDELLRQCSVGSENAKVTHVDVIYEEPEEGFDRFTIL